MARLPPFVAAALLPLCALAADRAAECLALQETLHVENTTVLNVAYVAASTNVTTPGVCQATTPVTSAPLCRVQFVVNTTSTSAVHAEAWLPDVWFGRFLATGDGGLGGCIDYASMDYGASLHFATFGIDNGHDGNTGVPFLNHPEVINDFAWRAVHVEAVVGKQIVQAYYGTPAAKSYWLGCSTGGRQGTQAALKFPADFDGILAGAPATDWNHLIGWLGMNSLHVGGAAPADAPVNDTSPKFIPETLWPVVSAEILRQCDALDGVVDGIITEPDTCDFRPEPLACKGKQTANCLTPPQIQALRNIYSPLLDVHGKLLYPRYSPGAEADPTALAQVFGGALFQYTADWERYVILNVTSHNFTNFGVSDIALWDKINAGGIATFDGNLSAFHGRGGKFITYHGRRDPLIASTNSKRVYDLIADTLKLRSLDAFYRLFLVPGMGHCSGGVGSTRFGQGNVDTAPSVNASSHNILLALVDWVEGGKAPATIIGSDTNGTERTHCRYPMRSVWDGRMWVCL
ncbi:tannase and feruloyl esterase [Mycena rosella]|uniref:Carboxylic ester hydrolase n=1 Tax=Mycena rosella TaxID=1033263 RepID=A0AAD7DEP2_MYCRO|nr:tannase and feruloyl esterase [Mycena rosella]